MNNILMVYPALVTWLALILYFFTTYRVGTARANYQISPPITDGPEGFMRVYRTQQNTMEQLVLFLPALWLFSLYISPVWGSLLGLGWIIARLVYIIGYYQEAGKRLPGFIASILIVGILMLGALWGMTHAVFAV